MSRVFIDRPIFATVLSVVIVIAGLIAYFTLPVAQYPALAPPQISVNVSPRQLRNGDLSEQVDRVLEDIIVRCRELKLRLATPEDQALRLDPVERCITHRRHSPSPMDIRKHPSSHTAVWARRRGPGRSLVDVSGCVMPPIS